MPIRGKRSIKPSKGGTPTGIFSTNGRQKQDGATGPHMDLKNYAHSGGGTNRGEQKTDTAQGKRHQQNFGINNTGHAKRSIPTVNVQMPKYSNPKQTSPGPSPKMKTR